MMFCNWDNVVALFESADAETKEPATQVCFDQESVNIHISIAALLAKTDPARMTMIRRIQTDAFTAACINVNKLTLGFHEEGDEYTTVHLINRMSISTKTPIKELLKGVAPDLPRILEQAAAVEQKEGV
jgi:hypothetical protein